MVLERSNVMACRSTVAQTEADSSQTTLLSRLQATARIKPDERKRRNNIPDKEAGNMAFGNDKDNVKFSDQKKGSKYSPNY